MTTQHATPAVGRSNPPRLITRSELLAYGRLSAAEAHLRAQQITDRMPRVPDRGIYVGRRVVNEEYFRTAWDDFRTYQAPRQCLPDLDPNLHVTVAYSTRSPDAEVAPDPAHIVIMPPDIVGVRILGPARAVVLVLRSTALSDRFQAYHAAGAECSYASYQPHITLFYLGKNSLETPALDWRPAFPIELSGEVQTTPDTEAFGKAMTVYHGSPETDLNVIHALPQEHQFDNPTGAFGAFFTPDVHDASRYAGKGGRVYEVAMPVENPYNMSVKEFGSYTDPQQVIDRRAQLIAGGFDGLIVREGGDIQQLASFIDVPVEGSEKPKTSATKPADVLAKSAAAFGAMSHRDFGEQTGAPGEHLYHSTSRDNLESIASEGLKPRRPSFRGEQEAWPNGGREGRVYLAARPGGALNFAEPDHALLRVHRAGIRDLKAEFRDADYYTTGKVRPQHIEVLHDDGAWRPIADHVLEKAIQLEHKVTIPIDNGDAHLYHIIDPEKPHLRYEMGMQTHPDGHAHIVYVRPHHSMEGAGGRTFQEQHETFANTLGVGGIRSVFKQVRSLHPGIKTFSGDRVTGARVGPAAAGGMGGSKPQTFSFEKSLQLEHVGTARGSGSPASGADELEPQKWHRYDIVHTENPSLKFRMHVTEHIPTGDFEINDIGAHPDTPAGQLPLSAQHKLVSNSLGVSGLRQVISQLRGRHPNVRSFSGDRITGARVGPATKLSGAQSVRTVRTLEKSIALHQENVSQATFMGRNLETRHTIYHIHDVRNPDLPDRVGTLHVFHERPLEDGGQKHEGSWRPKGLHLELSDEGHALGAQGINHLAVAVVRAHPEFHDYALSKVRQGRQSA